MKRIQRSAVNEMFLGVLCISVMLVGVSQAQSDRLVFVGKLTLDQPTQWGTTLLQSGTYTIGIESTSMPVKVKIRDGRGRAVAIVVSGIDAGKTSDGNRLLITEKGGKPHVYALTLASIGRVLVYDPALAQAVREARVPQTVPVVLARR